MTLTERLRAGSGFTEAEQGIARYLLDSQRDTKRPRAAAAHRSR